MTLRIVSDLQYDLPSGEAPSAAALSPCDAPAWPSPSRNSSPASERRDCVCAAVVNSGDGVVLGSCERPPLEPVRHRYRAPRPAARLIPCFVSCPVTDVLNHTSSPFALPFQTTLTSSVSTESRWDLSEDSREATGTDTVSIRSLYSSIAPNPSPQPSHRRTCVRLCGTDPEQRPIVRKSEVRLGGIRLGGVH